MNKVVGRIGRACDTDTSQHLTLSAFLPDGEGNYIASRALTREDILNQAAMIRAPEIEGTYLKDPQDTVDWLQEQFSHLEHEVFAALWLNSRNRVICSEVLFRGTINGSAVHPREVVKSALAHNATSMIACHNHPSGITTPGKMDKDITARLQEALALVDVGLLDHIIVGDGYTSMAAEGLL